MLNKIDQISIEELDIIYKVPHCVPISAHHHGILMTCWKDLGLSETSEDVSLSGEGIITVGLKADYPKIIPAELINIICFWR